MQMPLELFWLDTTSMMHFSRVSEGTGRYRVNREITKFSFLFSQVLSEMTWGGLDYTFECIGNVETMVR